MCAHQEECSGLSVVPPSQKTWESVSSVPSLFLPCSQQPITQAFITTQKAYEMMKSVLVGVSLFRREGDSDEV